MITAYFFSISWFYLKSIISLACVFIALSGSLLFVVAAYGKGFASIPFSSENPGDGVPYLVRTAVFFFPGLLLSLPAITGYPGGIEGRRSLAGALVRFTLWNGVAILVVYFAPALISLLNDFSDLKKTLFISLSFSIPSEGSFSTDFLPAVFHFIEGQILPWLTETNALFLTGAAVCLNGYWAFIHWLQMRSPDIVTCSLIHFNLFFCVNGVMYGGLTILAI